MSTPKYIGAGCGSCILFGALEALTDALILLDDSGRILHANHRAIDLLDLEGGAILGSDLGDLVRHPGLAAFWKAAAGEKGPVSAEVGADDGLTFRATISPCLSSEGDSMGRLLILRDVTREKKLQVEISAALAERLAGMDGAPRPSEDLPELTRREREILGLLAAGLTNAQMAERLNVSVNTIASHIKNLYPKIRVTSRSQAAAFAVSRGIIARPD
ncbi:MAG TPA: PAS and helix-turn-helix domain-containing protein [Candidatus Saccharimonadales bacterium]|nr:PAS and helix-turn-helix domain-containing protein [Candidatus Saccharimonadales bacterium]